MSCYQTPYGTVTFVDSPLDVEAFESFLSANTTMAVDTETTGLDIFAPGFRVRLVQFGNATEAFVLCALTYPDLIGWALGKGHQLVMHNATYDALVLSNSKLAGLDELYARTIDTRVMAHILDPRGKQDGSVGHGLKALSEKFVDSQAPDGGVVLKALFREHGWDWATVPLHNEEYVTYAGLDVLLTMRLYHILSKMLDADAWRLVKFEMRVQAAVARMQVRGIRLDTSYALSLLPYFDDLAVDGRARAAEWGVENVNSTKQVAEVLEALGANLVERTKTNWKVDKKVLEAIVRFGNPDAAAVALAVMDAKQAGKFKKTYVEKSLAEMDADERLHPWIHSLQARTARMSVSTPPLQQLPSGDWRIRRMFIADPGMAIVAVDYAQVELRVLAVLANERKMIDAVNGGADLHDVTAINLFGNGFTKAQRKLAKNVGFGRVYGGGAPTLARQAGVTIDEAKKAMRGYDSSFPGIKRYSNLLQARAQAGVPEVVTPAGRHLPMDRDRLYSATNYMVQSTSRDVLANAILELEAAGLGDHLLLPIHDEVLAQAPIAEAAEVAQAIAEVMTVPFGDLTLTAEPEVYGASWGHGYGATDGS
jgi:DNA polymerase-1